VQGFVGLAKYSEGTGLLVKGISGGLVYRGKSWNSCMI
jgi:hypothetical protein